MLTMMLAIGGCTTTVSESALKAESLTAPENDRNFRLHRASIVPGVSVGHSTH